MSDFSFLFYVGDYLRDVFILSAEAQRSYNLIMCGHMKKICFTYEELKPYIKGLNAEQESELFAVLSKNENGFFIDWVINSIEKRRAFVNSRAENRRKKDNNLEENKKNISSTYVKHMEIEIEKEIEIKKEENPRARALIDFVNNETEQLNKFIQVLQLNEAEKLLHEYSETDIKAVFLAMDNKKDIFKKNVSVFKTALFWLQYKNEKKQTTKQTKNEKFNNLKSAAKSILSGNTGK